jgi:hypothetical protein
MKLKAATDVFGSVVEIGQTDFVRQVTEASRDIWVVVFMYKQGCDF